MEVQIVKEIETEKVKKELKTFSKEEVTKTCNGYFGDDDMATEVWIKKYALKDSKGNLYETNPDDMHRRMAKEFAAVEKKYEVHLNGESEKLSPYGQKREQLTEEKIYELFERFKYVIPQGSVMASLGNPFVFASLSNCIVIPEVYDSYGGIMYSDQQLAQLMKRRCVEENTLVETKEKGIISIKDIKKGMHILSFDTVSNKTVYKKVIDKFYSEVSEKDKIKIEFKNGTILKTSKKHPILTFSEDGYTYKKGNELNVGSLGVKPEFRYSLSTNHIEEDLAKIGWFIGAHLGDGSCGFNNTKNTKEYGTYIYKKCRFRILGDNENIVKEYTNILNNLNGSKSIYSVSNKKKYKTKCWEYSNSVSKNEDILIKYLDNQHGSKTYSAFVPSFIKNNDLMIPFIAGLIDTDGYVKENGASIVISLRAKRIIDEVSSFLSLHGISFKTTIIKPRRINEKTEYRLYIHSSKFFWEIIKPYLVHEIKKEKIEKHVVKEFSDKLLLTNNEYDKIIENYDDMKWGQGNENLASCILLLKKNKCIGIGGLNEFEKNNLITDLDKNSVLQRNEIISINADIDSKKYVDLEVQDTNNFFAGSFGLVCIHNCGVGVDISTLRPAESDVSNAAGTSTGAISFMERFSNTTREVAQSGRRGALMITIDVNHPDVEYFAKIKNDLKKVTGANISIKLSDEFMTAVKKDTDYVLKFPINSINPVFTKTVKARELWNTIVTAARDNAEPGLIFWDKQHNYSTSSVYPQFKNISTNPCSEIAMGSDSCRLIALNLFGCVENPFTKNASFNYEKFYQVVYEAQRLMDDLVDLELKCVENIIDKINKDPEPEYIKDIERRTWKELYEVGKNGRRTGLGFTALADTIAALGYKFDSNKSIETIEKIMKAKCEAEFDSSIDMAVERGQFKGFDAKIEETSHFVQMLKNELPHVYERMMKHGRRNVSISTVAPNGSLSIIAQTSSGVEPVFMLSYTRRRKVNPSDKDVKVDFIDGMGDKWQEYQIVHPKIKTWREATGKQNIEESPYFGSTAEEIDWIKRVKIQSVVQKYITHSISSTINLPETVTVEKVGDIYMKSWEMGLKGITVYRSGSRSGVLISNEEKKKIETDKYFSENHAPKRPKILDADVIRFTNGGEKWIGFVGLLDGRPYEVFTGKIENFPIPSYIENGKTKRIKIINKKGEKVSKYDFVFNDKNGDEIVVEGLNNSFDPEFWNYAKLVSGILRHGMPLPYAIDLISGLNLADDNLNTWKAGVARMIKHYIKDGTKSKDTKCSECGTEDGLVFEEGCLKCKNCGYSKC